MAGDLASDPIVLDATTSGGTVTFDLTPFGVDDTDPPVTLGVLEHTGWLSLTPTTDGSLVIGITDPAPWEGIVEVWDTELDETHDEAAPFAQASVVWSADQQMLIRVHPFNTADPADITIAWSYAARASSVLTVSMEYTEVEETPGGLGVDITNGFPGDTLTFSLVGPTTATDFQTCILDDFGSAIDFTVALPALSAGDYYLHVESTESGAEEVAITILEDALSDSDPTSPVPTPPTTDPALHWRFIDMFDTTINYQMPHNPASWSNIHPPNDMTHDKTTAPDGQLLTWQSANRAWRMEFTGYLDTEEEYASLQFWSELHRRFWLIDHRNRAWLITFEQFDAKARVTPGKPWSHDYTMKTLIFMQGTD